MTSSKSPRLRRKLLPILACAIATVPALAEDKVATESAPSAPAPAAEAAAPVSEADQAWKELASQSARPNPPAEWRQTPPTGEAIKAWQATEGARISKVAEQARAFAEKYPTHEKAEAAKDKEIEALSLATRFGNEAAGKRLDTLDAANIADPKASVESRLAARSRQVQRAAQAKMESTHDRGAAMAEIESGARAMIQEFPGRSEPYQMLMQIAGSLPEDKQRAIAEEIAKSDTIDQIKDLAKGLLKKLDAVGKPVGIKFTSIDGREVNLADMKGKVVLVDFWATWCGPCVGEIPHVKEAYAKYHDKGFEIVGISLDRDVEALKTFVKEKEMPWPQCFDEGGKLAKEFGITGIPAMWLIDKNGLLNTQNGREDLAGKVEALLSAK